MVVIYILSMKTVRLSQRQLRGLIREVASKSKRQQLPEAYERVLSSLNELYAGSNVGSYLKQAITKLWEADNMVQRAMQEIETDEETKLLSTIHQTIENLAFQVDHKVQTILSGDVNKAQVKKK